MPTTRRRSTRNRPAEDEDEQLNEAIRQSLEEAKRSGGSDGGNTDEGVPAAAPAGGDGVDGSGGTNKEPEKAKDKDPGSTSDLASEVDKREENPNETADDANKTTKPKRKLTKVTKSSSSSKKVAAVTTATDDNDDGDERDTVADTSNPSKASAKSSGSNNIPKKQKIQKDDDDDKGDGGGSKDKDLNTAANVASETSAPFKGEGDGKTNDNKATTASTATVTEKPMSLLEGMGIVKPSALKTNTRNTGIRDRRSASPPRRGGGGGGGGGSGGSGGRGYAGGRGDVNSPSGRGRGRGPGPGPQTGPSLKNTTVPGAAAKEEGRPGGSSNNRYSNPSRKNSEVMIYKLLSDSFQDLKKNLTSKSSGNGGGPFEVGPGSTIDLSGSFLRARDLEDGQRYDFFDRDENGRIVMQPTIPMFPEDFSLGQKEWPLSWWGIVDPALEKKTNSDGSNRKQSSDHRNSKKRSRDNKSSRDRRKDERGGDRDSRDFPHHPSQDHADGRAGSYDPHRQHGWQKNQYFDDNRNWGNGPPPGWREDQEGDYRSENPFPPHGRGSPPPPHGGGRGGRGDFFRGGPPPFQRGGGRGDFFRGGPPAFRGGRGGRGWEGRGRGGRGHPGR